MADPASCSPGAGTQPTAADFQAVQAPQLQLLDFFFPGFSVISGAVFKYLKIDLNVYIPMLLLMGGLIVAWRYFSEYFWSQLESHFMSTVDIRTDDEIYNMIMAWVAAQRFAQKSRRFVVNTNLNSRSWFIWRWDYDDDDDDGSDDMDGNERRAKKKALQYTPTFGSHYFWYKGRLLIFRRSQNREQAAFLVVSEREEVSVSCFGRNPWILKELLLEARAEYMKKDEQKTLIYRGTTKAGSTEPTWQRCMARTSRPFSTVILNEKVKNDLIDDVTDYLNPATRRWYSNRGIPYRRGYLLYGPPGTGKSSLSLALAGFFKMRIYIVSLSSVTANEENLAALFAELPRRCVVLLEDIDTAGLTHTREENKTQEAGGSDMVPGQVTPGQNNTANPPLPAGRLSLSGLLNILDGVASQEGRVLIMTTNHVEKLDKALIRPGRVDMIVKFDLADHGMIASIFRAIFAPLEEDNRPTPKGALSKNASAEKGETVNSVDPEEVKKQVAAEAAKKKEIIAKIERLAEEFASKIPEHEFSPAELQGYLLKNKRDPQAVVDNVEAFITDTRKERKEKQLKDAEDRRKAAEEAAKKEEKAKRKEAKKKQRRKDKKSKKDSSDSDSSDSSSSSESEAEKDDAPKAESKKEAKKETQTESKTEEQTSNQPEPSATDDQVKKVADEDQPRTGTDSGYGTP